MGAGHVNAVLSAKTPTSLILLAWLGMWYLTEVKKHFEHTTNQHIADLFSSYLSFEKLTLLAEQSAKNKKLSFFENPFFICLLIYSDSNHSSSFSFKNLVRILVASAWALPEFQQLQLLLSIIITKF